MARKERLSQAQVEERDEFYFQDYLSIDWLAEIGREHLGDDWEAIKVLIMAYHYGTRFSHLEAYNLCSVGKCWPEFCRHPEDPNYTLDFCELNTTTGGDERPQQFENWVDENRQMMARAAAEGLEIAWEEIEKLRRN